MTIDARAYAWCSLGKLSPETPATLADSHVQGSGVVTVRGTVVLRGVKQVAPGTAVDLAYSDGQRWIARVPRRLRVLSSSINPLAAGGEGETTLSVGCKLAYMQDRKPPITNPTNEEENSSVPEVEKRVATPPITAAFVVGKILDALGLTAAGAIPLTISRIVDEWDLSAGYVEELSRIVASEGYFCCVNEAEQVEFISKNQEQGPGVLVTQQQVIELSPMNVGELPGEAVLARYTSLKLVPPDANLSQEEVQRRNWENETVTGDPVQVIHTYTDASGQQVKQYIKYSANKNFQTSYDSKNRVTSREERSQELNGLRYSITTFSYPSRLSLGGSQPAAASSGFSSGSNDEDSPTSETTLEFTPVGDFASACGFDGPHAAFLMGNKCTMKRTTGYSRNAASGITMTTTQQYVAYMNTPFGSDSIARLREAGEPVGELLKEALGLVSYGSEQRIRTEREYGLQKRPGQAERTALASRKAPSVEQKAELVWAVGSSTSQTVVELNPPYVSDDRIVKTNGVYTVESSGAEAQALTYARIENRLLLANRNGCGLQLQPLHTPPKPFDLLYIRLNGATGCFRVNGTTWTIGADGAVCTIDALFWGAIDGTLATAWFPLPPGVSSLPATAAATTNANPLPANAIAIPSGFNFTNPNLSSLFAALPTSQVPTYGAVINPAQIVKPYHETVDLQGGVQVGGSIEVQTWIATEVDLQGGVQVGGEVQPIDLLLEIQPAHLVLQPRTMTFFESEPISALEVSTAHLALQPRSINLINLISTTELLLEMEGTGGTFIDSSLNNHTVFTIGSVTQSTAHPKWGNKSAEFDGTGGAIVVPGTEFVVAATEAFSIGFWLRLQSWGGINNARTLLSLGPDIPGAQAWPYIMVGAINDTAYIELTGDDYRYAKIPWETQVYVKIVREESGLRRFAVNGVELYLLDSYQGIEPVYDTKQYADGVRIGSTDAELAQGIGLVGHVDQFQYERIATTVTDVPLADNQTIASTDLIRLAPAHLQLKPYAITLTDAVAETNLVIETAHLVLQPKAITLQNASGTNTAVLLEMEGSGSTFVDTSGNNNAVTVYGTVIQSTAQAKWGSKSAEFAPELADGYNGLAVAGDGFPIAAGDPLSIGLWFRPGSMTNPYLDRFLLWLPPLSGNRVVVRVKPHTSGTQTLVTLANADNSGDLRTAVVSNGQWCYIKVVRELSGLRRFAVNGTELFYEDSYEGVLPIYDNNAYTNGFRVGPPSGYYGIAGHVDHVRLELASTSVTEVPTGP